MFKIQISHIYAVKGHSYCVCDRQFALFTKKVKKMEKIQHPDEYIRILEDLNNIVLRVNILDFEKLFSEIFTEKYKVKILFQKKIIYQSNGFVMCFKDFYSDASTFNYQDKIKVNLIADLNAEKPYYISNEKTKDVQ